jgi:23S rRNA pseudouridine2605 synthase
MEHSVPTETRYRLKDKEKKHVKAKPPRASSAGGAGRPSKPKWEGDDKPARAPRSRSAASDDRPPPRKRFDSDGPKREWTDRPPSRGPRRDSDGPKREWTDRPPRREFGDSPRGRSAGPKREWSDRPPRREFGDGPPRGPRRDFGDRPPRAAGGGNAEVMEALGRIEASLKDLTKRITLIENQLDEVFGEE